MLAAGRGADGRTKWRVAGIAVLIAAFGLNSVSAAARSAPAISCTAEGTPARVTGVLDRLELTLDDGRVLRLAGIDPAQGTPARPRLGEEAQASLARWLVGRSVQVRALSPSADRWNRIPSLVFANTGASSSGVPDADGTWSAAEALLDAGWARAKPEAEIHACFAAFLAAEAKARAAGLGLWADPYYAIVNADDRSGLVAHTGAMTLVEGRFQLGKRSRYTVVKLGRGTSGLVVFVAGHLAKQPSKGGTDLQGFVGARVRVRGFLDDRFGLRVDLANSDQIEMLGPATTVSEPVRHEPAPND